MLIWYERYYWGGISEILVGIGIGEDERGRRYMVRIVSRLVYEFNVDF